MTTGTPTDAPRLAGYALTLALALINIVLNFAASWTAASGRSYLLTILSPRFLLLCGLSFLSLLALVALYRSGFSVARGILIAGAVSILVGTIAGVVFEHSPVPRLERLTPPEWALMATMAVLLLYRIFAAAPRQA